MHFVDTYIFRNKSLITEKLQWCVSVKMSGSKDFYGNTVLCFCALMSHVFLITHLKYHIINLKVVCVYCMYVCPKINLCLLYPPNFLWILWSFVCRNEHEIQHWNIEKKSGIRHGPNTAIVSIRAKPGVCELCKEHISVKTIIISNNWNLINVSCSFNSNNLN